MFMGNIMLERNMHFKINRMHERVWNVKSPGVQRLKIARRRTERRRMTIAIAIMLNDGIVLGADTEESGGYPGDIKTSGQKVLIRSQGQDGVMAVTGAGDAGYLDAVFQELEKSFLDLPDDNREARISETYKAFYEEHVLGLYQFDQFRRPENDPDFDLILAMDRKPDRRTLLVNSRKTLRHCYDFVTVGAGAEHARMLLDRTYSPHMSVGMGAILAAYTIFSTKEHVSGCGKKTEVFILRKGSCSEFGSDKIAEMEAVFSKYLKAEAELLSYALGYLPSEDRIPAQTMKRFSAIRNEMLDVAWGSKSKDGVRRSVLKVRGHSERGMNT